MISLLALGSQQGARAQTKRFQGLLCNSLTCCACCRVVHNYEEVTFPTTMNNSAKKFSVMVAILVLTALTFYFGNSQPVWIGMFYPDKGNLFKYRQSPAFKTVKECREWAISQATLDRDGNSDYECAKNCKANGAGPLICEETIR